jgi:arylsulfatase A-like enzyme
MEGFGRSIDISPTLLDIANIKVNNMDGISMLPDFETGRFPERERFAENVLGGGCISMVRNDGNKFVSTGVINKASENIYGLRGFPEHRLAVFNLNNDPNEFDNLIGTPHGKELQNWAIETHKNLKLRRE